ncbi:hypothetical protein [Heyndrickxia coagulans]|uniref:hypothetical protein n=1 Tax=Heyndrickxia coagulans TaxID=1398 RepID=UPI0023E46D80|nr:hypothetical protein [Heyndrickxia coagulans]
MIWYRRDCGINGSPEISAFLPEIAKYVSKISAFSGDFAVRPTEKAGVVSPEYRFSKKATEK